MRTTVKYLHLTFHFDTSKTLDKPNIAIEVIDRIGDSQLFTSAFTKSILIAWKEKGWKG